MLRDTMSGYKWMTALPQLISRINHKNESIVTLLKVLLMITAMHLFVCDECSGLECAAMRFCRKFSFPSCGRTLVKQCGASWASLIPVVRISLVPCCLVIVCTR